MRRPARSARCPSAAPLVTALALLLAAAAATGAHARASAAPTWHGGPTIASTGETVNVLVSDEYQGDPNTPERWANVFAGLVHGKELASVLVHVATPATVQETCGADAIGCYVLGGLYLPGEPMDGVAPEAVAAHEYGHHLAVTRLNPPWVAVDWGTKRWATHMRICPRQQQGLVFPGNRDWGYRLNPGEGFVEAYRVLNEVRQGAAGFTWTTVDNGFYPDARALDLVEQDVLEPWLRPTTTTLRARFTERGPKTWTRTIALPLDGTVEVVATMPPASGYAASLRSADGSKALVRARWTYGAPTRTLSYVACGTRTAKLQLVRTGGPGVVTMRISKP